MAGKRVAEAPPGLPPKRNDKKQKTTVMSTPTVSTSVLLKTSNAQKETIAIRPETLRNASTAPDFTVVPATPGTIVDLSAKDSEKTVKKKTRAPASSTQQKQERPKSQEPPTSLPLEPHAAILAELQRKYAVRVLSVISSTRMEKRIKAILDHLANGTPSGGEGSEPTKALPGVVLLHARAPDANKLVSIAEIAKRRIREGHFEAPAADLMSDGPPKGTKKNTKKKKNGKDAHAAAVAWYQYDRIYDVKSTRKKKTATDGATGNSASGADDTGSDEEEDGFEPAMHRLEAALGDKNSGTVITTYMSIILSRTPLLELHKNPEISVQCSTDPLEIEYEQFMAES